MTNILSSFESARLDWDNHEVFEVFSKAAKHFVHYEDGYYQIWAASLDWFLEEWGRDTFISLPGVLLTTNRFEEAKSVFRHFAQFEKWILP